VNGARRAASMDAREVSPSAAERVAEGGVRWRDRVVGARGSWERERRGGGMSSDEGEDRRDCKSGGGGDKEDSLSSSRVERVIRVDPLVAGTSFARPTPPSQHNSPLPKIARICCRRDKGGGGPRATARNMSR
jgi:hypothetical protein